MEVVKSKSYTLKDENGHWLGQVVLTEDGMFASVTDYGNLSYAWRHYDNLDFRQWLRGISVEYFANKLFTGMAYVSATKQVERACKSFAEHILPTLQEALKREIEQGVPW